MSSISQAAPAAELPLTPKPQLEAENGPAAQAAAQRKAERLASLRNDVAPDVLQVSLDTSAGRFVQVLTDADTEETLRRYPSEGQLAYSRAVMAYMRALTEA
ncbi:MAG: hypothetical protein J0L81_15140 [Caulobacterales bacterium]|jgi:hypothetical protein|nr:hypothetical protein [Caulobacterales bacterium]